MKLTTIFVAHPYMQVVPDVRDPMERVTAYENKIFSITLSLRGVGGSENDEHNVDGDRTRVETVRDIRSRCDDHSSAAVWTSAPASVC